MHKRLAACLLFVCGIFLFRSGLIAQTDTTVVDTVSFSNIDSLTRPEDDVYADTAIKHIYDTSQYFFNWKDDYHQLYTKAKFAQRHLIDKDVKELKAEKDFWYIPAIEKMEARLKTDTAFRDSLLKAGKHQLNDEAQPGFEHQQWFYFLFWFIIAGAFIAAVIYFLLQQKINFFSQQSASGTINENEQTHENIFLLQYHELLQKAEQEKNYRVAVRLLFLETLKILSETNNIHYQPDYTNLHYSDQLRKSKLYNEFLALAHNYEYIWYGKFEPSHERFISIKKNFLMFQHRIT